MTLVLDLRFIPPPPPVETPDLLFSWFGYLMLALLAFSTLTFGGLTLVYILRSHEFIAEYNERSYRPLSQVIILGLLVLVTFGGTWIDNEIQIRRNDEEKAVQRAAEREIIDKIQPALEEYYKIDISTLVLPQTPTDDGRALLRHEGEPNEGCDLNVVNNEYRISCDSADLEHATELTPRD